METIASFTVNHLLLDPKGVYVSRQDRDGRQRVRYHHV